MIDVILILIRKMYVCVLKEYIEKDVMLNGMM